MINISSMPIRVKPLIDLAGKIELFFHARVHVLRWYHVQIEILRLIQPYSSDSFFVTLVLTQRSCSRSNPASHHVHAVVGHIKNDRERCACTRVMRLENLRCHPRIRAFFICGGSVLFKIRRRTIILTSGQSTATILESLTSKQVVQITNKSLVCW